MKVPHQPNEVYKFHAEEVSDNSLNDARVVPLESDSWAQVKERAEQEEKRMEANGEI